MTSSPPSDEVADGVGPAAPLSGEHATSRQAITIPVADAAAIRPR
jgi:hypothetical protein